MIRQIFRIPTARRCYHVAATSASATPIVNHISSALGLPVAACELLEHALDTHVPTLGFSETAVLETLRDNGYSSAARSVFPGSSRSGQLDLVLAHLARSRAQISIDVETQQADPATPVTPQLGDLLKKRLLLNAPIASHLAEAQAILTQPAHVPSALTELHELSSDLWNLTGDRSHSFDWYTKRASLSALYVAAELVMSQDKSSEFRDTIEFVDRRLQELNDASTATSSVTEYAGFFAISSVNVLKSFWLRSGSQALTPVCSDFTRLKTVLRTDQVFDILSNAEVAQAHTDLAAAIDPTITALLRKADLEIERLERKERELISKGNLQEVRLMQMRSGQTGPAGPEPLSKLASSSVNEPLASKDQIDEILKLQRQRDRLKYTKWQHQLAGRQK
ncbi:uncharacterized protein SAPINGB_P000831 [Magnusiomyces paraingens]|uniref:Ubiquinone biosynthesis protein n=1 Tax=Magnusiomyces paraingens TaxID=2606893 RepID=A0A5E8B8S6_9ASCO|nr:uncharacterized protein SAPINGB_P000831 [Saprochaete ingens]VVT45667.1 unnamed protein product [Saprochaete ingens]